MKADDSLNRRFISYMANLIYYNSINYDKKRRMKDTRFPLTLDNDDNMESVLLTIYDPDVIHANLRDHITDYALFQAYETLSSRQQEILSLAYVHNLKDEEIAKKLGYTQQNISKHRLKALEKLRRLLTEG